MQVFAPRSPGLLRRLLVLVATVGVAATMSGCASFYVDSSTGEVPASDFKKIAEPKPVQFVFEFETKGVANARATDALKSQVVDQVKGSGLFATVDDKPVDGGAILSLKLNNVPLTDDAFSKGFVTGLTLGLAGNQVADGYLCTVEYLGSGKTEPIKKTVRHAIYTVVGAKEAPKNGVAMPNAKTAVQTMTRQIVGAALRDLSNDPAFN